MKKQPITLTKDGEWLHGDGKVTHKRTIELFFKSVYFENGKYYLSGEKRPVPIVVEDVAFFITGLKKNASGFVLKLSNGEEQALNPNTFDQNAEHILYCQLENGAPARFERKVYYELMKKGLVKKEGYLGLVINDVFYPLERVKTNSKSSAKKKKPKKAKKKKTASLKIEPSQKKSVKEKVVKKKVVKKVSSSKKSPEKKRGF